MYILKMMPMLMELIITYSPEKRSKRGFPCYIGALFKKEILYVKRNLHETV